MRMPTSSHVGSIGIRLIARPDARRAVNSNAAACSRCTPAAPSGGVRVTTSSTPGQALTDQFEPFETAVLVIRRRRQRLIAVHRGERHVGIGREEAARVVRLHLASGLTHPTQTAQIVFGHPRLHLLRLGVRRRDRLTARRATDGNDPRPPHVLASLAVALAELARRRVEQAHRCVDRRCFEGRPEVEHLEQLAEHEGFLGGHRDARRGAPAAPASRPGTG